MTVPARRPAPAVKSLGARGEDEACAYLEREGYRILRRNYRFGRGEVDIIALEGRTIVFVEVKTRAGTGYGEPEEAVTPEKIRRIRRIASGFMARSGLSDGECRFDVVAVMFEGGRMAVRHTRDIYS